VPPKYQKIFTCEELETSVQKLVIVAARPVSNTFSLSSKFPLRTFHATPCKSGIRERLGSLSVVPLHEQRQYTKEVGWF